MDTSLGRDDLLNHLRPFYSGKRVTVSGGASFIGSHLVDQLCLFGAQVRVADDLSSGRLEHLELNLADIEVLVGDLRSASFTRTAAIGTEILFHLAASHGGRGYIDTHPVECVNNMALDNTVFDEFARAGVATIVHASSACAYPVNLQASAIDRNLLRETDANFELAGCAYPDGEYGWAKLMGELQLRAFHKQYGINGIACRIFTVYGERENESHAVVALIAKALARLDPYPIWGDGRQTRNFTYVKDTVAGLLAAGALLNGFDVVNVGSSRHDTVLELCETIFELDSWSPEKLDLQLDMPVGVLSRAADNRKMQTIARWEPSTSLLEGVAATLVYCRETFSTTELATLEQRLMSR